MRLERKMRMKTRKMQTHHFPLLHQLRNRENVLMKIVLVHQVIVVCTDPAPLQLDPLPNSIAFTICLLHDRPVFADKYLYHFINSDTPLHAILCTDDEHSYDRNVAELSETPNRKRLWKLMKKTYTLRRKWVLDEAPPVLAVLSKFPCLKQTKYVSLLLCSLALQCV